MSFFVMFDNIKIINSVENSVIYNFSNGTIKPVESNIVNLLNEFSEFCIEEVRVNNGLDKETMSRLLNALEKEGFGFIADETLFSLKKDMSLAYNSYSEIDVLDLFLNDKNLDFLVENQIYLGRLGLKCVILRSYSSPNSNIQAKFKKLELPYVVYNINYSCSEDEVKKLQKLTFLKITSNVESLNKQSGIVEINNLSKFHLTKDIYIESLSYNVFYNKRLFVLENGDVSDALIANDLGITINDDINTIRSAVREKSFFRYSNIPKSRIEECQKCIYRNMCLDKRIPSKTNNDSYSFENKCEDRKVI